MCCFNARIGSVGFFLLFHSGTQKLSMGIHVHTSWSSKFQNNIYLDLWWSLQQRPGLGVAWIPFSIVPDSTCDIFFPPFSLILFTRIIYSQNHLRKISFLFGSLTWGENTFTFSLQNKYNEGLLSWICTIEWCGLKCFPILVSHLKTVFEKLHIFREEGWETWKPFHVRRLRCHLEWYDRQVAQAFCVSSKLWLK